MFALLSNVMAQGVYDVTSPGDVVVGVPDDGDWPAAKKPEQAIDDNVNTKYLHFKGDFNPNAGSTGLRVTPSAGPTTVMGLTFSTANDFPGRDPVSFELYGSNGTIDGPYTLIASGDILDFRGVSAWPRLTKNSTPIIFPNDVDYKHYQLLFTAIRGPVGGAVNSMQIAEVEMLGPKSDTLKALGPQPADGAVCTNNWVNLSWMPGELSASHHVYFSDDINAVTERRTSALVATTDFPFASVVGLQMGTTYYWCVDEFNNTEHDSPWLGKIWNFRITAEPAVYLLITNKHLAPAFGSLVERRTEQGFPGRLLTLENIYATYAGEDEPEQIKNCIINHYENYETLYVALGGDDVIVPVRYCYTGTLDHILPADLYYSDMDGGDWDGDGDKRYGEPGDVSEVELIPEVHLGRIPVRTADDARAYVNKVIIYEEASPEDYAGSILLAGGNRYSFSGDTRFPGFEDHDPVAGTEINVTNWYLDYVQPYALELPVHRYFYTNSHWDELRCGDDPWGPRYLEDHLNEGYQLLLYHAHASPAGWGMGVGFFRERNAARLTNPLPCIVVTAGCAAAGFDLLEPSMCEAFLRNPNGGAVAFFGFSRSGAHGLSRMELSSELFRNRQTSIGQAITRSQSTMASRLVGAPWRQCQFILLGDPLIHLIPEREGRHLQIFQPKGLEIIQQNSDVYIRWNAAGTGFTSEDLVKLQYSADSRQTWYDIPGAEALPYDGRLFIWENCNLPPGREYRIRAVSLSDTDVSDMSDRDFTIGDLGLLAIRSAHAGSVLVEGSYRNWTDYNVSILKGEAVTLRVPEASETPFQMPFVRWSDGAGNTLSESAEYTFTFTDDATVIAEYGYPTATYYVNDETPEDGVAAGNDMNNGLTPGAPVRRIQTLFERHPELGWGDVIRLSPGTYFENIVLDANNTGLTLAGAGHETTVIDAQGNGSCLSISHARYAHISGIKFTNGIAEDGGGLTCSGSRLDVRNCAFAGNMANGSGGGMSLGENSGVLIADCMFLGNITEGRGGGIICSNSKATITGTTFQENTAGKGGAITARRYAFVEVADSLFLRNTAHDGGAICNWDSQLTELKSCLFEGNEASRYGGVAYVTGGGSEQVFENCVFRGNRGRGGGVLATFGAEAYATVINCTFSGNSAKWKAGVLYVLSGQNTNLTSCILWDNGYEPVVGDALMSYCNVQGGWEGEGNIDVDPLFADPAAGDYHLKSQSGRRALSGRSEWVNDSVTSPCIDAGNPDMFMGDEPQPNGGRINMGAYGGTAEASKSL
jgi:hypothetical protein